MIIINQNGQTGQNGQNGSKSQGYGKNGSDGTSGQNGTEGLNYQQNINIILKSEGNKIIIHEKNQNQIYDSMILGDNINGFKLMSEGGDGGKGGDGGDGGSGQRGSSGNKATENQSAGNGGRGGNGGNGGNGGAGGFGGNGGDISIEVSELDLDLLMLIQSVSVRGGIGGDGGKGGAGGAGGSGGSGGSGYSRTIYKNGRTEFVSKQGGRCGSSGKSGTLGNNGEKGYDGKSGQLQIILNGESYKNMYKLQLINFDQIQSPDNVIEPGEVFYISNLLVKNIGDMPSPFHQKVCLSQNDNQYIQFEKLDSIYLANSIDIGKSVLIQEPLKIQIKDQQQPFQNSSLRGNAFINIEAKVERVNKYFDNFQSINRQYDIRYPIEISKIQSLKQIQRREEAPIAFSVWNRSSKPIGFEAEGNRLINIRLLLVGRQQQDVEFIPKKVIDEDKLKRNSLQQAKLSHSQNNFINSGEDSQQIFLLDQQFITNIAPDEKKIISGTLRLKDFDGPFYEDIKIEVRLDLGYYHDQSNKYQTIQIQQCSFQVIEGFEYKPNSEYLIIYNSETQKDLIQAFKKFANSYGSNVDLWNISNYKGFSFDYFGSFDNSLKELYKEKVIVIFDNSYKMQNNEYTNTFIQMEKQNIIKAAMEYSIHTYIIGNNSYELDQIFQPQFSELWKNSLNVEDEKMIYNQFQTIQTVRKENNQQETLQTKNIEQKEMIPQQQSNKNQIKYQQNMQGINFDYVESYSCFSSPSISKIAKKCENIQTKIRKINPLLFYYVFYEEQFNKLKSNLFTTTYSHGNIQIIPTLRRDCSEIIISREDPINKYQLSESDHFSLLKLLQFNKKLLFFERTLNNYQNAKFLIQSIFSDLIYEQICYEIKEIDKKKDSINPENFTKFITYPFEEKFKDTLNLYYMNLNFSNYTDNRDHEGNEENSNAIQNLSDKNKIKYYMTQQLLRMRKILVDKLKDNKKNQVIKYYLNMIDSLLIKQFQLTPQFITQYCGWNDLQYMQNPYQSSSLEFSNTYYDKIQSFKDYKQTNEKQDINVQEGEYIFYDEKYEIINEQRRQPKIEEFEQMIKFDEDN